MVQAGMVRAGMMIERGGMEGHVVGQTTLLAGNQRF
jgi:hypothetical protein